MDFKKILARVSAVSAAVALPVVATAAVGDTVSNAATGTGAAVEATITLTASINGIIQLRIYERFSNEANLATGILDAPSPATQAAEGDLGTVEFGVVTTNPNIGQVANAGYHVDTDQGALFVARLNAALYYTGAPNGIIQISGQDTTAVTLPGTATRGFGANDDYWGGFNCVAEGSTIPAPETAYRTGTAMNFGSMTDNDPADGWQACTSYTDLAGVEHINEVDLALHIDDGAPNGDYGEDFVFRAYISN